MDFLGGFFENLWLKIVRYNAITVRFKAGSIDLSPTRSVADITELQEVDKVTKNSFRKRKASDYSNLINYNIRS